MTYNVASGFPKILFFKHLTYPPQMYQPFKCNQYILKSTNINILYSGFLRSRHQTLARTGYLIGFLLEAGWGNTSEWGACHDDHYMESNLACSGTCAGCHVIMNYACYLHDFDPHLYLLLLYTCPKQTIG